MEDIFESAVRSAGDIAGVFESDGETSYFYLWLTNPTNGKNIIGAIQILSEETISESSNISIRWDDVERRVGLFVDGSLRAVFDDNGQKFGGDHRSKRDSGIPEVIKASFLEL